MAFLSGLGRPGDLDTLRRKMQGSTIEVREIGRGSGRASAHRRASSSSGHHKSKKKGEEVRAVEVVYVRRKSGDLEKKGKGRTSGESKSLVKGVDNGGDEERGNITRRKKSVRRPSAGVMGPDALDPKKAGDEQRAPMKRSTSQKPTTLHHLPSSPSTVSHRPPLSRRKTTFTDTRKMASRNDPHRRRSDYPPSSYDQSRVDRAEASASASARPRPERRTASGRSDQPSSTTRHSKSSRPPSPSRRTTTTRQTSRPPTRPSTTRASTSQSKSKSRPNIVSALFGGAPAAPEKELECVACMTDCPASEIVTLHCKHHMCHDCIKRVFTLSLTDPQSMPPKCCDPANPIDPKTLPKLFTTSFKRDWNEKYEEYRTKNRIYCSKKGCGKWIRPENIHVIPKSPGDPPGPKRKYGQCSTCKTRVCTTCNAKFHASRECPKDPATLAFQKIAKEKGWRACYNCKATVEHNKGCNHMTCRCKAEFCMTCGVKWKGCDCPLFGDEAVQEEHDRVMREYPGMPPAGGWFWFDDADDGMGMGGDWDAEWAEMQAREAGRNVERQIFVNGHRVEDHGGFDHRMFEADAEALGRQVDRDLQDFHIHDYDYDYESSSSSESDDDLIFVGDGPHRRDLAARRTTHRDEPRRRTTTREEPRRGHDDGARRPGGAHGNFAGEGRRLNERDRWDGGGGGGGGGGRRYDGGRTRMRTATPPLNPHLSDDFFRRGHDILARPYNDDNDRDAGMLVEEINNGRTATNRRTGRANAPPMRRASTLAGIGTGVASRARRAGNGGGLNGRVSEWRRYVD